jgi:hypothetical protein
VYAQLDLQVIPKKEIPSNFHQFWIEELHCEKKWKKTKNKIKYLMFEHYNLMNPI